MWHIRQLDVGDGIAGETVTKLTHDEIGIVEDKIRSRQKDVYLTIKNHETHRTFRFKMSNLI